MHTHSKYEKREYMPRTEEANQRIREERREQILDVAARVFARNGLAATRIADIASAGEMSQGLIFRYFASKEEIFAALVERALHATISTAQAALQQPCSPLGKLRWLLQIYLSGMWRKPEYSLVIQHALFSEATSQEVRELALEQANRSLQIFRQLIIEGQEAGEVVQGDPIMLALALAACIQGLSSGALYLPLMLGIDEPPDPEIILRILKA
jgi:AcrR family transcriptional regulator